MKKIKWGILGLGAIANKFAEAILDTKNANLFAISSKNPEKLKNFQERFNIKKKYTFSSYVDLINCEEIDILYIALPNSLHYEWVIKCIQNNRHVLVEKPSTTNFQQMKNIKKILVNKKIFFGEAFMYRYLPQTHLILDLIKSDQIGNLISMKSVFGVNLMTKKKFFFFNKKKKIDSNSRLFNKNLGGGCILDLGCYPISFTLLMISLFSKINEKKFKIHDVIKEYGETNVDIDAHMRLSYGKDFFSQISASFKENLGTSTEIIGDKGKIKILNTWFGQDKIIKINNQQSTVINSNYSKNIYSYQIEKISENITNNFFSQKFPGMEFTETFLNMKIIDHWLNA
jgi:predicted dehydrogenase